MPASETCGKRSRVQDAGATADDKLMRHIRALHLLYSRPKLHYGHDTLVDPRTMATFNTLAPGDLSMSPGGSAAW